MCPATIEFLGWARWNIENSDCMHIRWLSWKSWKWWWLALCRWSHWWLFKCMHAGRPSTQGWKNWPIPPRLFFGGSGGGCLVRTLVYQPIHTKVARLNACQWEDILKELQDFAIHSVLHVYQGGGSWQTCSSVISNQTKVPNQPCQNIRLWNT